MLSLFRNTSLQSTLTDLASPNEPEVYLIPPANVVQVLTALDDLHSAMTGRYVKKHALWALIAELVPAVAADPSGNWDLQVSADTNLELRVIHNVSDDTTPGLRVIRHV